MFVCVGAISELGSQKMAATVCAGIASSNILLNVPGNEDEFVCERCRDHETQLKEALDELSSAHKRLTFYKMSCSYPRLRRPCVQKGQVVIQIQRYGL